MAPGIIDTDMQALIRGQSKEVFPEVDKFLDYKAEEAFNTTPYVAEYLLHLAFDPSARPEETVVRIPAEN